MGSAFLGTSADTSPIDAKGGVFVDLWGKPKSHAPVCSIRRNALGPICGIAISTSKFLIVRFLKFQSPKKYPIPFFEAFVG
jgi:hypothetical protein